MKKIIIVFTLFCASISLESQAQCAMCKTSVESNQIEEADKAEKKAKGLNTGILYLMILPYAVGGVIYYMWLQNSRKEKQEREAIDRALDKLRS